MNIKFKLSVLVVCVFIFATTHGQTDFVSLTSSQILKGLNNKDYFSKVLTDEGFSLIKKTQTAKDGALEYWQFKSLVFIDVIYNPGKENYIIVRVYKDYGDFSERLIQTFPQKRDKVYDDRVEHIKVTNLSKDTAYNLAYSKEDETIGVNIWYDDPFYFFQYTYWK